MKNKCPHCESVNTTRFQWYGDDEFQFWTCWDCDFMFCLQMEFSIVDTVTGKVIEWYTSEQYHRIYWRSI